MEWKVGQIYRTVRKCPQQEMYHPQRTEEEYQSTQGKSTFLNTFPFRCWVKGKLVRNASWFPITQPLDGLVPIGGWFDGLPFESAVTWLCIIHSYFFMNMIYISSSIMIMNLRVISDEVHRRLFQWLFKNFFSWRSEWLRYERHKTRPLPIPQSLVSLPPNTLNQRAQIP